MVCSYHSPVHMQYNPYYYCSVRCQATEALCSSA